MNPVSTVSPYPSQTLPPEVLASVCFDEKGLLPAIAQDVVSGEILMVAWMDRAALERTIESGRACYYSRSRQAAWMKGERSGHLQIVREILLDCDGDVVLLKIDQLGSIACHTGRRNCFYRRLENGNWVTQFEPLKTEAEIYGER